MPETLLKDLFKKYLDETISSEEFARLSALIQSGYRQEELDGLLEEMLTDPRYTVHTEETDRRMIFASLLKKIGPAGHRLTLDGGLQEHGDLQENAAASEKERQAPLLPLYRRRSVQWAAAIILLLSGGLYWYQYKKHSSVAAPIAGTPGRLDAPPGKTGAILTLADGRQVQLDSALNGTLARQGSTALHKQGGRLDYQNDDHVQGTANGNTKEQVAYNTLATPRGRQFELELSDGTRVWLNAASSITYPTVFTGKERKVTVTGEAYFDVSQAKDRPFRVQLGQTEVVVLGTRFDVTDYDEENAVNTTLVQGAVKVVRGTEEMQLSPGIQASYDKKTGKLSSQKADVEAIIAWTKGRLAFNNPDFSLLMRQISRWYDVDVEYQGNIPTVHVGGFIHRNVNLATVLDFLEENGVHFRTQDKKIIILP